MSRKDYENNKKKKTENLYKETDWICPADLFIPRPGRPGCPSLPSRPSLPGIPAEHPPMGDVEAEPISFSSDAVKD